MLVNKDFLTWLLIGWRLCWQPIRCQVWNLQNPTHLSWQLLGSPLIGFAIEIPGCPFYVNLQKRTFLWLSVATKVFCSFSSNFWTKMDQYYISCIGSRGRERWGSVVESSSLQMLIHCGGYGNDGDKNANIWSARSAVSTSIPTNITTAEI